MGYLHVLWSRDCKIPYVYLTGSVRLMCRHPRGPCGFRTGMATALHSVLRETYCPGRMHCGLWNTRTISGACLMGADETRECTLGLYLLSQSRLCYIWPIRANKTTNWPSMGTKSLVAHVWKLYMLNHQPWNIRRPHNSKFFETSCGLVMHAVWFPMGTERNDWFRLLF